MKDQQKMIKKKITIKVEIKVKTVKKMNTKKNKDKTNFDLIFYQNNILYKQYNKNIYIYINLSINS